MARPERPLDPQAGPIPAFAQQLRDLRTAAGNPKYVTMARTSGRSRTALTEAAGGDHFPTWNTVSGYVEACGANPDDWIPHWETTRQLVKATQERVLAPTSVGARQQPTDEPAAPEQESPTTAGPTAATGLVHQAAPPEPPPAPPTPHRRRLRTTAVIAGIVITSIGIGVGLGIAQPWNNSTPEPGHGTGHYDEQAGTHGAPAFGNPFTVSPEGGTVGPNQHIDVLCRVYAPSLPSVIPDGYWYRLGGTPWNGHFYAAASAFWNGDRPGHKPYTHNTDYKIPLCPDPPKPTG